MKCIYLLALVALIAVSGCREQNEIKNISDSKYGYSIDFPNSWSVEIPIMEGFELRATSPDGLSSIKLQSRYIEGIPPNVNSHKEWVELQYSEIPEEVTVEKIEEMEFVNASCFEVLFKHQSDAGVIAAHSLNVMNYISDPALNRMWIFVATTANPEFLASGEYRSIVESLRLENFKWKL